MVEVKIYCGRHWDEAHARDKHRQLLAVYKNRELHFKIPSFSQGGLIPMNEAINEAFQEMGRELEEYISDYSDDFGIVDRDDWMFLCNSEASKAAEEGLVYYDGSDWVIDEQQTYQACEDSVSYEYVELRKESQRAKKLKRLKNDYIPSEADISVLRKAFYCSRCETRIAFNWSILVDLLDSISTKIETSGRGKTSTDTVQIAKGLIKQSVQNRQPAKGYIPEGFLKEVLSHNRDWFKKLRSGKS